jgi:hypothetical protein
MTGIYLLESGESHQVDPDARGELIPLATIAPGPVYDLGAGAEGVCVQDWTQIPGQPARVRTAVIYEPVMETELALDMVQQQGVDEQINMSVRRPEPDEADEFATALFDVDSPNAEAAIQAGKQIISENNLAMLQQRQALLAIEDHNAVLYQHLDLGLRKAH